jgi:hypothetical protein
VGLHAEPAGHRELRVDVNREHPPAAACKHSGEIDRRGRLTDTALLIGNGNGEHHHTSFALV